MQLSWRCCKLFFFSFWVCVCVFYFFLLLVFLFFLMKWYAAFLPIREKSAIQTTNKLCVYELIIFLCSYILYRGISFNIYQPLSLCSQQSTNRVSLSHQTSHQSAASQQYFSLTSNQHQPPATAQRCCWCGVGCTTTSLLSCAVVMFTNHTHLVVIWWTIFLFIHKDDPRLILYTGL